MPLYQRFAIAIGLLTLFWLGLAIAGRIASKRSWRANFADATGYMRPYAIATVIFTAIVALSDAVTP